MKIRYWKHRVATLRKDLLVLFGISLTSILFIDLWLIKVPEVFGFGAELGGIYYKICLAYITAFIFYFINVHLQSERTKVKTYKYINNKSTKILNLCNVLMYSLRNASGIPSNISFPSKTNEIFILCDYIDPRVPFTLGGWYARTFLHWQAASDFIAEENKELIRDLLFVRDSLDSDIVEILTDIDDCIQNFINLSHGGPSANTDMEVYSYGIIQYYDLCKKLINTIRGKYKYHKIEYHDKSRKSN
jgi:hypothetical protein